MTRRARKWVRGQLLRAAVGFAGCSTPSYDCAPWALRTWLDSWPGIGRVVVGMASQGYDLQLTRYDEKGWRSGRLHPDGAGIRGRRTVNVLPFRGPSLNASTVPP